MPMRYHFRVLPPSDTVKLHILESDRDGPLLAATFNGRDVAGKLDAKTTLASGKTRPYISR
jgi:DUF1365 family protein